MLVNDSLTLRYWETNRSFRNFGHYVNDWMLNSPYMLNQFTVYNENNWIFGQPSQFFEHVFTKSLSVSL